MNVDLVYRFVFGATSVLLAGWSLGLVAACVMEFRQDALPAPSQAHGNPAAARHEN